MLEKVFEKLGELADTTAVLEMGQAYAWPTVQRLDMYVLRAVR